MNDVQNSEPDAEEADPEADEVDSFDQHVDNLLAAQDAQKRKGHKTTEFWDVKTIESDGTIKQVKLSVKEAMKPPNGRKEMFHFEEDSRGIIKGIISKMLGRAWKETRNRLYHRYYDAELSLAANIENRPDRITADHWKRFLDYRNSKETQDKCKKNAENRSKQLYTHTGGSKSLARLREEESERQGRIVSRGELYLLTHKKTNGSYIHDAARAIGERIEAIEQGDESSRLLSQNDSLAQALGRERPSNGFEREETQRVLLELQAELAAEKLKRKAVEDEVAAEKTKRQAMEDEVAAEKTKRQAMEDEVAAGKVRMQAMESALICLLQGQAAVSNRRTFRVDHRFLDRGGFKPPLNIATLILGFAAVVPAVLENRRKII
ncbi:uncharacterized protein LOC130962564 [Arachis stenosperma]|uniref:uncharacterized protein LOC130962564 n=1 Tax=Arachis stenosperma TaxID=217475 RepID=UPI0025AC8554|nr:uncharacterized protein LOC130962564 [Arachis stenosperma]